MVAQNLFGDLALEATQDDIRDTLQGVRTASGKALAVGNARTKFRDGFSSTDVSQPNPAVWTLVNTDHPDDGTGIGHFVAQGGDASGSSYLRISMSPFVDNSSVWLVSKEEFSMPSKVGWGISASQRVVGQDFFYGVLQSADVGNADVTTVQRNNALVPVDVTISGTTGTITTNSLVVSMPTGHPFKVGDRVMFVGCADTRMNVGPVIITGASANDIAVPLTLTNGTYSTVGGVVRYADPLGRAQNGFGMVLDTAAAGTASMVSRRNGSKPRIRSATIVTTAATAASAWADSFVAPGVLEQYLSMDECSFRSFTADSGAGTTGLDKFSQGIPDEELKYRLAVRARNLDNLSKPIARITNISRTSTTTATVTTDRAHNLTTNSRVGIWGVRDAVNFPNTSEQAVTAVLSSTQFQVAFGTTTTSADANGGLVFINHGNITSPGAINFNIQSIARVNGVLVVTLNTAATGFVSGEYIQLWGLNGAGATVYEGAYKVARQTGSTVELHSPGANFGAVNTGGGLIRRTEYRLHFSRILDHTRHFVEVLGGRGGQADTNNSVPVSLSGTITANMGTPATIVGDTTETVSSLTANGLYSGATRDLGTDTARHHTRVKIAVAHMAGQIHSHLWLEQSHDNVTFIDSHRVPVPSDNNIHTFEWAILTRYFRWRMQNGATAQTRMLLHTRRTSMEGTVADEISKVLNYNLTSATGQGAAASATTTFPQFDLGTNHKWSMLRYFSVSDVAGTLFVDESPDGTNWFTVGSGIALAPATPVRGDVPIMFRYYRLRHVNGAGIASAVRVFASLVSL